MKAKLLTITEIVDAAVEMGFDISCLVADEPCLSIGATNIFKSYYYETAVSVPPMVINETVYVSGVTIQDLVMCDEFMRVLWPSTLVSISVPFNDIIITDYMRDDEGLPLIVTSSLDMVPFWKFKRIRYLIAGCTEAHKEISDRVKSLKHQNEG